VAIPFEGSTLPGYHFRAAGARPRPTVILLGGYDGTVEELYIEALRDYSLACHAERITCPTFVCNAEADDISASAPKLAAALRCPHDLPRPRLRPARRGVVTRPLQIGYFPHQVTVVRSTS
jgi:hypothetical protein